MLKGSLAILKSIDFANFNIFNKCLLVNFISPFFFTEFSNISIKTSINPPFLSPQDNP